MTDLHPIVAKAIEKLTTDKIELDEHLKDAIKELWWIRFGCDEANPTTVDYELELNELVYWALSDLCDESEHTKEELKPLRDALQKYEDSMD